MTDKVYCVWQSDEDDRPNYVTYFDPSGHFKTAEGFAEFQRNSFVSEGRAGYKAEQWVTPDLFASKPGNSPVEEWDFYKSSGSFGDFSPRAIGLLMPFFGVRFVPLPSRLEGHSYFCLRCESRIDCLDEKESSISYFDGTQDVVTIEKYVFRKASLSDQMFFAIPQLYLQLFCTSGIPEFVHEAKLKGFSFELIDQE
jgi:hypothetical protein